MRISTAQINAQGVVSMLDRQAELAHTQQQLATGNRIITPSDDVVGTTQIFALQQVIDTHKQYNRNIDFVESRLQQEEAAVTQVADILQRARELAVQAENSTLTAQSRALLAPEVRQELASILGIANSKDPNGEYLFAGFNVGTAPFTAVENPVGSGLYDYNYTGDLGQRNVQVASTRQIAIGDPGSDVFVDVPLSGGGTQSIFETLEQFAIGLETNSVSASTADDLLAAIDHLAGVLGTVGGRLNAIDSHKAINNDVVFQGQTNLSSVQDLDYAEAISRMNLQLAGLEASQQSFARVQNLSLFNYL